MHTLLQYCTPRIYPACLIGGAGRADKQKKKKKKKRVLASAWIAGLS